MLNKIVNSLFVYLLIFCLPYNYNFRWFSSIQQTTCSIRHTRNVRERWMVFIDAQNHFNSTEDVLKVLIHDEIKLKVQKER